MSNRLTYYDSDSGEFKDKAPTAEEFESHQAENVAQGDNPHGVIYEEGEWTPILAGGTVAGSHTYERQQGGYVRNGNLIHLFFALELTNFDTDASGEIRILGIPFDIKNAFRESGVISAVGGIDPYSDLQQYVLTTRDDSVRLSYIRENGTTGRSYDASRCQNNFELYGSIQYIID